jgi:hypothetical protein
MLPKWFEEARFGMFIHWGLYAALGGLYKDQEMTYIGEWIEARFRIPNAEYGKLAETYKMDVEKVKAAIPADSLTADVRVQKALDLVKASAVIK